MAAQSKFEPPSPEEIAELREMVKIARRRLLRDCYGVIAFNLCLAGSMYYLENKKDKEEAAPAPTHVEREEARRKQEPALER